MEGERSEEGGREGDGEGQIYDERRGELSKEGRKMVKWHGKDGRLEKSKIVGL